MSPITVVGGTGFIGGAVVRALEAAGRNEKAPVRSVSRRTGLDVTRPETLRGALDGTGTLVQALQFPTHPVEIPRRGWTYEHFDGLGTENLVAEAKRAGVRRYVYVSGAGVRPGRREAWFRAKHRAEEAVRTSGIPWTILRPSWVYGPGDRSLNKFVAFVRYLPFFPMIGTGEEKVAPLFVDDLAALVVRALDDPRTVNAVFEVGGPEAIEMNEIVRTLVRVLGVRRPYPIVPHPKSFMKTVAWFLEFPPTPPLSRDAVDFVTMEEPVDDRAARDVLGWNPRRLEEALRAYLPPAAR